MSIQYKNFILQQVVIVNELVTQVNKNNEISFESAGGQAVSSRCNKRIMLARIRDSKFAARLLKSSTMPQVATVFNVSKSINCELYCTRLYLFYNSVDNYMYW